AGASRRPSSAAGRCRPTPSGSPSSRAAGAVAATARPRSTPSSTGSSSSSSWRPSKRGPRAGSLARAGGGDEDSPMTTGAYLEAYRRSLADPNGFWGDAAAAIDWITPLERVLDDDTPPFYRWFTGGTLNTCY